MYLQLGAGKLKLELSPQHGYVLRVSRKEEKALRSMSGLNTLQTKKARAIAARATGQHPPLE